MVTEKEIKALQSEWTKAKPQTDCSLPDGSYEFLIVEAKFGVTKNGVPQMGMTYEVVGGNESFIGEKVIVRENLQTSDNMGWFKKKLARLSVTVPEDVSELQSKVPKELVGKKFAGQLKSKDEFFNVYVNKFIEDVDMSSRSTTGTPEEDPTQAANSDSSAIAVGDTVMFTSSKGGDVEGELLEINEENKGLIKTKEGKSFRVSMDKVSKVEVAEETVEEPTEEAVEEEAKEEASVEETSGGFPTVEEIKAMKLPALSAVMKENGFDIAKVKVPRTFMTGISGFIYNEKKYMPDLATLVALRDGLGVTKVAGTKPKDIQVAVLKKMHEMFEF